MTQNNTHLHTIGGVERTDEARLHTTGGVEWTDEATTALGEWLTKDFVFRLWEYVPSGFQMVVR